LNSKNVKIIIPFSSPLKVQRKKGVIHNSKCETTPLEMKDWLEKVPREEKSQFEMSKTSWSSR